jgi:hypothetical protein
MFLNILSMTYLQLIIILILATMDLMEYLSDIITPIVKIIQIINGIIMMTRQYLKLMKKN